MNIMNSEHLVDYSVRLYDPAKFSGKVYNGTRSGIRRCRFCGRILDATHFTKEAHAISVSLGNNKFICADECNDCNEKFGRKLENDITYFFQVFLSIYYVPKRNGEGRKINGRNFEMQMSDKSSPFSSTPPLIFHMRDWKDEDITMDDLSIKMKDLDLSNKTFVPQNLYKALCKYALSLMPHSTTLHYQKTIAWIRNDSIESSLPKLRMATFDREGNEPIMMLFIRNTTNAMYPLCVASLCVANLHFFYVLPFCDESEGTEQDNILFDSFWAGFPGGIAFSDYYKECDFSNGQKTAFKFEMNLTLEPGAVPIRQKKDENTEQWMPDE